MVDFAGEMAYNGASEQVLETHVFAVTTGVSFCPQTTYLFGAKRAVHRFCYAGYARVSELGSKPNDERRALRVQEQAPW